MIFKIGIVVMAPDADPEVHRSTLKTHTMEYTTIIVQGGNIDKAVDVCKELVQKDGVQSLFLCPGFNYEALGRIKRAVGDKVSVNTVMGSMQDVMLAAGLLGKAGVHHRRA